MAPLALAANDDHDLAYSLGASLGERLRQEMPGLQLDALVEGLKQSYQGQPLKLDKARMQAVLQQHEAQADNTAEQAQAEKTKAVETRFMANERARAGVGRQVHLDELDPVPARRAAVPLRAEPRAVRGAQ